MGEVDGAGGKGEGKGGAGCGSEVGLAQQAAVDARGAGLEEMYGLGGMGRGCRGAGGKVDIVRCHAWTSSFAPSNARDTFPLYEDLIGRQRASRISCIVLGGKRGGVRVGRVRVNPMSLYHETDTEHEGQGFDRCSRRAKF